MRMRLSWVSGLAAVMYFTHFAGADIGFTRVVDTSTLIPGTPYNFAGFGTPSLSSGDLAFFSGGGPISNGVYSTFGGLHTIADTLMNFPGTTSPFISVANVSLSNGQVAFNGTSSGGHQGVIRGNGSLEVVADRTTAIPNGDGTFTGVGPAVISDGIVAFRGVQSSAQRGVYQTTPGGLVRIADRNTQVPGWPSALMFSNFLELAMDDQQVAFIGQAAPGEVGVYSTLGGALHAVADRNTVVPGESTLMRNFYFQSVDDGKIAFSHESTDFEDYITANFNGALEVLVDEDDMIPETAGENDNTFFKFGPVALSGENVVFGSYNFSETHRGAYALFEGELSRILEHGDILDGRIVAGLGFTAESFDGNQFAFRATFTDGSSGIYLATLPEPATGALLLLAASAVAIHRRRD